jgi:cytoskeletal protein CcmA (bactofilin family)
MADKMQTNDGNLSLIGAGTTIEGKVKADGSMRVDGKVIGDVTTKSNVTIGATGMVEGTVTATNVALAGRVQGTVVASDKLVLENKSVMRGDIRAAKLVVDEGAVFDGQVAMSSPAPGASHPAPPPALAQAHPPVKEKER